MDLEGLLILLMTALALTAVIAIFPMFVCFVACDGDVEKDEILVETKVEEDGLDGTTTDEQSNSTTEGWFDSTCFLVVSFLYFIVSCDMIATGGRTGGQEKSLSLPTADVGGWLSPTKSSECYTWVGCRQVATG